MTTSEIRNDMLYHAATSVGKSMLEQGLITEDEYTEIDTILLEKYHPFCVPLFSPPFASGHKKGRSLFTVTGLCIGFSVFKNLLW